MMKVDGKINNMVGYQRGMTAYHLNKPQGESHRLNHDTLSLSEAGKAESTERLHMTENGRIKESQLEHQSRIEKIKVDIENGNYSISKDLVVDAILRRSTNGRS